MEGDFKTFFHPPLCPLPSREGKDTTDKKFVMLNLFQHLFCFFQKTNKYLKNLKTSNRLLKS
jgi:hypothetical protein